MCSYFIITPLPPTQYQGQGVERKSVKICNCALWNIEIKLRAYSNFGRKHHVPINQSISESVGFMKQFQMLLMSVSRRMKRENAACKMISLSFKLVREPAGERGGGRQFAEKIFKRVQVTSRKSRQLTMMTVKKRKFFFFSSPSQV